MTAGKDRRRHPFRWCLLGVLLVAAGSLYTDGPARLAQVLFGGAAEPEVREVVREVVVYKPAPAEPKPAESPAPHPVTIVQPAAPWHPADCFSMPAITLPPFPPALPEQAMDGSFSHFTKLQSGINMRSRVDFRPGSTAAHDRKQNDAYLVHLSMSLYLPHAADGTELAAANPDLKIVLADYDALMGAAKVSHWWAPLMLHKQNEIRKNAGTLSKLLDRHNFYDTDTLLEITAPATGRKVLWMQADMDVVSDGSDGDRLPTMPEKVLASDYYQPTTSYRWKKLGSTPNPLLKPWQARLDKLNKAAKPDPAAVKHARAVINDLKTHSYLLAEYDPFIVIPLTLQEGRDAAYRPQPGDYAVVVAGKRVFPAIVGDYGPRFKCGEASLRLAKAVNPKATPYARPVSDLTVSYLLFPGSREQQAGPIDYPRLNTRCRELLQELGGLGEDAEFVEMEDLLKKPEPAPNANTPNKGNAAE